MSVPKLSMIVAKFSRPKNSKPAATALVANLTKPPINPSTIPVTAPLIPSIKFCSFSYSSMKPV